MLYTPLRMLIFGYGLVFRVLLMGSGAVNYMVAFYQKPEGRKLKLLSSEFILITSSIVYKL